MNKEQVVEQLKALPSNELVEYIMSLVERDIIDLDNVVDVLLVK